MQNERWVLLVVLCKTDNYSGNGLISNFNRLTVIDKK